MNLAIEITENAHGNAPQLDNVWKNSCAVASAEKNLGDWDECGIFGKPVHDYQNELNLSYLREVCDEI